MNKRYIIYVLEQRWDNAEATDSKDAFVTVLLGPDDIWWYPYKAEGYDTEEKAIEALSDRKNDKYVILPVYSLEK